MKKLFAVIAVFFATTIGTNAQENPNALAKKELKSLSKVIELDNATTLSLMNLLVYKHEVLAKSPAAESKKELAEVIQGKIEGTLTPEQFQKVKSNKKLFEDLLH